jgi:hypothetical protein
MVDGLDITLGCSFSYKVKSKAQRGLELLEWWELSPSDDIIGLRNALVAVSLN